MHRKNGFTLIELLVVIAIIALLLSVIIPALGLAKEKAKNLQCRANVRSLSIGFRLYTETNDGNVFGYGTSGVHNLWLRQIADQLGDIDKIRNCPSTIINTSPAVPDVWDQALLFGTSRIRWIWPFDNYDPDDLEQGSYGFNGWLYSDESTTPGYWRSATVSANSAFIPVFVDSIWVDFWPYDSDNVPANHDLEMGGGNMMCRFMIDRHGGKLSVSFLDGHVEPIALKRMWSLKWSKIFENGPQDRLRTDGTPIYE